MQVERKDLEQKNLDLQKAFRDKAKSQQQLNRLYQTLKQQQVAAGMELAAENDAEHTLHAMGRASHAGYNNSFDDPVLQSRAGSNGSGGGNRRPQPAYHGWGGHGHVHGPGVPMTPHREFNLILQPGLFHL